MILCSCRNISTNDAETKPQLLKLLLDPETIKCARCLQNLAVLSNAQQNIPNHSPNYMNAHTKDRHDIHYRRKDDQRPVQAS